MNTILSNADITDEELMSAIVGAEGLLNSRPLTYQSAHVNDILPLTPNHFLYGQIGGEFAPRTVDTTNFYPRTRWRRVQELVCHFWNQEKWHRQYKDFKIGDIVLLVSSDTPRAQWPLGRVIKVYPGPDGHVRTVDINSG